jgi:hypothetical protein
MHNQGSEHHGSLGRFNSNMRRLVRPIQPTAIALALLVANALVAVANPGTSPQEVVFNGFSLVGKPAGIPWTRPKPRRAVMLLNPVVGVEKSRTDVRRAFPLSSTKSQTGTPPEN